MKIEKLNRRHNRKDFDCGVPCLNTYLQSTARQHSDHGGSLTSVLVDGSAPTAIIGYFTMTSCDVDLRNFPAAWAKRYSAGPAPRAYLLARLAVDLRYRGKGYGSTLLVEALNRTARVKSIMGGWGLFVDAKDDEALSFYKHYGFEEESPESRRLFMDIKAE